MIELRGFSPAFGGVADSAFRPKLTEMLVIFFVADKTVLRSGLQVRQVARIDMTFGAQCQSVNTNQFERDLVMVEV